MCSRVFGAAVALALSLSGRPVSAQMDDVTMPGGEKAGTPVESKALLSESEFNEWAAKPGAVVFDLHYRGLTEKEIHWPRCFSININDSSETPFIKSIGLAKDKRIQFYLPLLHGSEKGLLEYEGKSLKTLYLGKQTAKALYLDLDCDGKVGPGEKMEPIRTSGRGHTTWYFVSPDFTATSADGKKRPFRVLTQVNFKERNPNKVMCTPFCYWEGEAQVAGTTTSLRLVDENFDGTFLNFGGDSFLLTSGSTSGPGILREPGNILSSLTYQNNEFYHLWFAGEGTKEKPLRAVLCKDTTPTGRIAFKVAAGSELKLQNARLVSSETPSVVFDVHNSDTSLPERRNWIESRTSVFLPDKSAPDTQIPEGNYRITAGNLLFGKNNTGRVSFSDGPEFRVVAGQTVSVEMGRPKLQMRAFDMLDLDKSEKDVKEKTSFPRNTGVYLNLKMIGEQGEEYGRISKQSEDSQILLPQKKPHLQILGPDGKEVASSDLEYG